MPAVDYAEAKRVLNETFSETLQQCSPTTAELLKRYEDALDIVFESKTQSYREVLLGCALVHIINPTVNIRLPYVKQGPTAFNGRTLDEQVINPFLMFLLMISANHCLIHTDYSNHIPVHLS